MTMNLQTASDSQRVPLLAGEAMRPVSAAPLCAKRLARLATQALTEEANLTPKPGLVDRRSCGAHHDLTLGLLLRSATMLEPHFELMAEAAQRIPLSVALRETLAALGRAAEREMLRETDGINTHRGAIWSLGLLIAAVCLDERTRGSDPVFRLRQASVEDICFLAGKIAALPDRHAPGSISHGEEARLRFGALGARGEAVAGFPHVRLHGLPALTAARAGGLPEPAARVHTLLALMAALPDTCLLHRGGPRALAAAQDGARKVLDAGVATPAGRSALAALDRTLLCLWASPGGSADLLAATLFLDSLTPSLKVAQERSA